MIRFKETEDRGGELTVTLNPFDLLSLIEGLTSANIHLSHLKEENPESWEIFGLDGKLKDTVSNINELERVMKQRNEAVDAGTIVERVR